MPTRPRLERDYTVSDDYDSDDPRLLTTPRHQYHYAQSQARQESLSSRGRRASHDRTQEPQDAYNISEGFKEVNEPAVPPPVQTRKNSRTVKSESRSSKGASARNSGTSKDGFGSQERNDKVPSRSAHEPEDGYDIPNDYEGLDELAAPAPVEHWADSRQGGLGDKFGGKDSDSTSDPVIEGKAARPSPPQERVSRLTTELYTISHLILFSLLGTLARLGLQALTFYPGAPIQISVLWANFAGSLIMGFLSEDRQLFRTHLEYSNTDKIKRKRDEEKGYNTKDDSDLQPYIAAAKKQELSQQHASIKKTIPLYIGLTTGFCGCFTSFSAFLRDAYLALSNHLPVPISHTSPAPIATASTVSRNGGYSFMAICAVIIITVMLCLGALLLGAHLAIALEPITAGIPRLVARKIVDRLVVIIAWTAWLGAVFMAIWPPDRPGGPAGQASWAQEFWRGDALFALVFAPLGCLLRFYASLHLNGRIQSFPLGTFAVNIFGTALEGMFYDLQHVPLGGRVGCQVLQGLMDGFCGCLTTVSTWVVELKGLRRRHAYIYGTSSVAVGVGLLVMVMGSLQWSRGFGSPMC